MKVKRSPFGRLKARVAPSPDDAVRGLHELFTAIAAEWSEAPDADRRRTTSYLAGFDTEEKLRDRHAMYTACLAHAGDLRDTVGCDIGCWLGFSAAVLQAIGPRLVYGIEIVEDFTTAAEAWRIRHEVDGVRFRAMREGTIPLLSSSIDWALINQVLCNAVRGSFESSLRETFRILRPGGLLVFCDSNNPHCPDTWTRLERAYRMNELGADGTPERPDGPYFRRRRRFIREHAPELDEADVDRLARDTCYHMRDEVVAALARFRETGRTPVSPFQTGGRCTPCNLDGATGGTITDPFAIAADLERIGFDPPRITTSASGEAPDNEALWEGLRTSQGFFVLAQKPRA